MTTYTYLAAFNVVCYVEQEIEADSPEEAKAKLHELGEGDKLWSHWDVDYTSAAQHRIVHLTDEKDNIILEDVEYKSDEWQELKP